MTPSPRLLIPLLSLTSLALCAEDQDLPQDPNTSVFHSMLENSPFTRSVDPAGDLELTGVANIGGRTVVTVVNSETAERRVISPEPNEEGWKLVELDTQGGLEKFAATIVIPGGESVTLRFNEEQLNHEQEHRQAKSDGKKPSPSGKGQMSDQERQEIRNKIRSKMSQMSEQQRRRAGEIMGEKMRANPNMSDRERAQTFVKIVDYVANGEKR